METYGRQLPPATNALAKSEMVVFNMSFDNNIEGKEVSSIPMHVAQDY